MIEICIFFHPVLGTYSRRSKRKPWRTQMDPRLVALKLVLNELHESDDISTVENRLRVQKAIYLAQSAGVGLGYTYSWYVKGPYSPPLTRDYYELAASETASAGTSLKSPVAQKLQEVRQILRMPKGVGLEKANWYELLASLHFLLTNSKYDKDRAFKFMKDNKSHLGDYLGIGYDHLKKHNMI